MAKVWSWLAVNLGRHAGLGGAIGLVFTIVLGFGITRLEFATGQDSYLNRDSDVYKDNVAYQERFGGQAMLSLIVMDDGKRVEDLFTPEGIETMAAVRDELQNSGEVLGVVSPLDALEFSNSLSRHPRAVTSPRASPARRSCTPPRPRPIRRSRSSDSPTPRRPCSARRRSRPRSARSTTPSGSSSCCTTTRARSARRCARSSPTRRTRRC